MGIGKWVKDMGESYRYASRKWKLTLFILTLATIGTFAPPMISLWVLCLDKPLVILSGTEWVSIMTLITGAYFGMNVLQKKFELSAGVEPDKGLPPSKKAPPASAPKGEIEKED